MSTVFRLPVILSLLVCISCGGSASPATQSAASTESADNSPTPVTGTSKSVPRAADVPLEWLHSEAVGVSFAKTEVTVLQYSKCIDARVCGDGHYRDSASLKRCNLGVDGRENHPMSCVTWHGASAYCAWVGGRLPTAEEWTAEATNNDAWNLPWGNEPPLSCDMAMLKEKKGRSAACGGVEHTAPVCSKQKGNSVSGLCDMAGNLWEWTHSESPLKVVYGAAWDNLGNSREIAWVKQIYKPEFTNPYIGFRCVRDIQK